MTAKYWGAISNLGFFKFFLIFYNYFHFQNTYLLRFLIHYVHVLTDTMKVSPLNYKLKLL